MTPRRAFILMSSHALPYARLCIATMLERSAEPVHLRVIADDAAEAETLRAALADIAAPEGSRLEVIAKEEVSARLAERWPGHAGLRALHEGHPCWRKVTDPLILSEPEDEIIVCDPDLYFPNRFAFEPTPREGVMMMRQGPNCLFPPGAVREVFDAGYKLANHVDIGVAQLRAGAVNIDWLDTLARSLDLAAWRPFMHVEAILWSAMAMRFGGCHLDPLAWRCWQRGHLKRLAVAAGLPGRLTLKLEPLARVKCIHVSGPSKWWVTEAVEAGTMRGFGREHLAPVAGPAYRELTRADYEREQRLKGLAARLGYYRLTGSG